MTSYADLDKAISKDRPKRLASATKCEEAFALSRTWLVKYAAEYEGEVKEALVVGSFSAAVEVVAAAYLGLVRSAVFSLRMHFDLTYAWLYYKDHPVEWRAVRAGSEQARLPAAIDQYLSRYYELHTERWNELEKHSTRKIADPYGRMSAFVHGGYPGTIPSATKPAEIVAPIGVVQQLPNLIKDVAEVLSDLFVSCHLGNWESLPEKIRSTLDARFAGDAKARLKFH